MRTDSATINRVFSDAHVIDVDLSEWDRRIGLWVLADHFRNWSHRCPVVVVEFEDVREFRMRMPSNKVVLDSPRQHIQWRFHDVDLQTTKDGIRITARGSDSSPVLTVECKTIEIREVDSKLLDKLNPGWNQPSSPFARGGVEKLVNRFAAPTQLDGKDNG
jgi:hypothetical protein